MYYCFILFYFFYGRIYSALAWLVQHHSTYSLIIPGNDTDSENEDVDLEMLTLSEDVSRRNTLLREVTDLRKQQQIYQTLFKSNDQADDEDILLIDMRHDDHENNASFLMNWKANVPMSKK